MEEAKVANTKRQLVSSVYNISGALSACRASLSAVFLSMTPDIRSLPVINNEYTCRSPSTPGSKISLRIEDITQERITVRETEIKNRGTVRSRQQRRNRMQQTQGARASSNG